MQVLYIFINCLVAALTASQVDEESSRVVP
jgi:hypothetical protein